MSIGFDFVDFDSFNCFVLAPVPDAAAEAIDGCVADSIGICDSSRNKASLCCIIAPWDSSSGDSPVSVP